MEPEEPESIPFAPLQEPSERILTRYYETAVRIDHATLLTEPDRRNRIWRCHLQSADPHLPETVIVKQVKLEGYDPSNPEAWDTSRFFNDWAGAQFLSSIAPNKGHAPAFYGGEIGAGFIMLEDLGEHTSLVEPLLEGDASSANEALLAYVQRLAQMHAASMGKEQLYRQVQQEISPAWAESCIKSPDAALQERSKRLTDFTELCTRLGVKLEETAKQEFETVLQHLEEPGQFAAFIHGDPCPDNVFYREGTLRLIDFEFSSFGHCLRDGLYGRLPFPTCWCANALPTDIMHKMEQTYRAELASVCPEILDEERFAQEASAVTASWVVGSMQWHLNSALDEDETWGIAGIRARILTRLDVFLATARNADQLPALCEICEHILKELHHCWADATSLPVYPAFRTEGS